MKRTVLVTGTNRGIGLAIARQLAELGNSVLLGARDLKAGEEATKSLHRPGFDIEPVHIDLTHAATIDAAIAEIEKSGRHVDTLVNNAGVLHEKPVLELTDAETTTTDILWPGESTSDKNYLLVHCNSESSKISSWHIILARVVIQFA